jgi:uncharacterized protein (DUF111 family)
MKKGRPGVRIEVLVTPSRADALETLLLRSTPTIGVRRHAVQRRALPRHERAVSVGGHAVRLKVVDLPGGGSRAKPEFEDVRRVAALLGMPPREVHDAALAAGATMQARADDAATPPPPPDSGEIASGDTA